MVHGKRSKGRPPRRRVDDIIDWCRCSPSAAIHFTTSKELWNKKIYDVVANLDGPSELWLMMDAIHQQISAEWNMEYIYNFFNCTVLHVAQSAWQTTEKEHSTQKTKYLVQERKNRDDEYLCSTAQTLSYTELEWTLKVLDISRQPAQLSHVMLWCRGPAKAHQPHWPTITNLSHSVPHSNFLN